MADNAIQAPGEASAETQEILKELESQGHQIAGKEPEAAVEEPKAAEPEPAKAEPAPEKKEPEKTQERTEKFVPVSKHNEERHKRQDAETRAEKAEREAAELRAQLASSAGKPAAEQSDDVREAARALSEKYEIPAELVNDLLETTKRISSKGSALPKELQEDLAVVKQLRSQAEAAAREAAQEAHFGSEFSQVLKEFPHLADRKEELKQLAFSEGNVNTSLRRIALEYVHDNPPDRPGRKTAEAPVSVRKDSADVVDFSELTEEQFKGLNDEQFAQYEAWLDKTHRRR